MLCCFFAIDGVGLNAALNVTGIPLVRPPNAPPWLFVKVTTLPFSSMLNGSLFSLPLILEASKPLPNSIPLTAGMAKTACEITFSTPPNIGSPRPAGRPLITHEMIPPTESPSSLALSISSIAFSYEASSVIFTPCISSILASTVMPAKVIDSPITTGPISPRTKRIWMIC